MIENLLPGEVQPDYDLTLSKLEKEAAKRNVSGGLDLMCVITEADPAHGSVEQLSSIALVARKLKPSADASN